MIKTKIKDTMSLLTNGGRMNRHSRGHKNKILKNKHQEGVFFASLPYPAKTQWEELADRIERKWSKK